MMHLRRALPLARNRRAAPFPRLTVICRRRIGTAVSVTAFVVGLGNGSVRAESFRLATRNLDWHIAQAELAAWRTQCSKTFVRNNATGVWEQAMAEAPSATSG